MIIEYEHGPSTRRFPTKMIVTFENEEDWFSILCRDFWIAKAVWANTTRHRFPTLEEDLSNLMVVTVDSLSEEEGQGELYTQIRRMLGR